jgi:hypothetical protein
MHVDAVIGSRAQRQGAPRDEAAPALTRLLLQRAVSACPQAQQLDRRLRAACSVRLHDMVDHIRRPDAAAFAAFGWRSHGDGVWRAPDATLPDIVEDERPAIGLRVDSIERFLNATGIEADMEGAAHGPYRQARIFRGRAVDCAVIERRGWRGHAPPLLGERKLRRARLHQQIFRTRRRQFQSEPRAIAHTLRLAEAAATDLGGAWAGALFLRAEREYWAMQCLPALRQQQRQLAAGVGWCTVRRHAYACSREHLAETRRVFEILGHTGAGLAHAHDDGGWGAIVLDASATGIAPHTLLCVDLAPHELTLGACAGALSPLTWLGPPGLWCGLHGESLLEAGLCSASAAYDLGALMSDSAGDLDRLAEDRRAARLTLRGEHKAVDPRRVAVLERARYIQRQQAETHSMLGAIGAQFEVVQGRAGVGPAVVPDFAKDVCAPQRSGHAAGNARRKRLRIKQLS